MEDSNKPIQINTSSIVADENVQIEDGEVVPAKYLPFKISGKDYSMSLIDKAMLKRYREWSWQYFVNDFVYESMLFLSIAKARDMIMND